MWPATAYRLAFAPVTLIGLIHIVSGIAVLVAPQTAKVSGLAGLSQLPPSWMGIILIGVGVAAIIGRIGLVSDNVAIGLIIPQQLVLMVQLVGIWYALRTGHYPDGYAPSEDWNTAFWFILGDQSAWLFLCVSHLLDMVLTPLMNATMARHNQVHADILETLEWYRQNWAYRPARGQPQVTTNVQQYEDGKA
jgi:hypothetical protein